MWRGMITFISVLSIAPLSLAQITVQTPTTTPSSPTFSYSLPSSPTKDTVFDQQLRKFTDNPENKGYFGLQFGSKQRRYESAPTQAPLQRLDIGSSERSLYGLRCSLENLNFDPKLTVDLTLPDFQRMLPMVSIQDFEQVINKKAVQSFLNQQFQQFSALEASWQPHISAIETMINQNFNSIVDLPSLSEQIFQYIQSNNLLQQLQQDCTNLQNIDWSHLSFETFINQEQLQNIFDQFSESYNLTYLSADQFLSQTSVDMNLSFHDSLNQTVLKLAENGFMIKDNTLYFMNPNNAGDRFSFTANLTNSDASMNLGANGQVGGSFAANAGNYLSIQGGINLNTDGLTQGLQDNAQTSVNQLIQILTDGLQQNLPLDQLLENMETALQGLSEEALPTILNQLQSNIESDFSLTLNLQALSDSFYGTGNYQFIDIILETLGHDVGSITLNKNQIMNIASMMAQGGNESEVGMYILEDVAGFKVDIVGYNVARDVANGFLSDHFTGNIISLQHSISQPGGLIQAGNTYFGSAKIREWKSGRLVATGSFNQRSIMNSPLVKDDGYLHVRTEIQSHSVGIAYLPRLWSSSRTRTRVDGMVQLEGLFVHAKSASVLTKTNLTAANQEVVELYRVPLSEIEGADKTYPVPMLSVGLNIQQEVLPGVCVNGYALCYPGLKQTGSLENIAKAITPKTMAGFSLIFNLPQLQQRQPLPFSRR